MDVYPNILFAMDGEISDIAGTKTIVASSKRYKVVSKKFGIYIK